MPSVRYKQGSTELHSSYRTHSSTPPSGPGATIPRTLACNPQVTNFESWREIEWQIDGAEWNQATDFF